MNKEFTKSVKCRIDADGKVDVFHTDTKMTFDILWLYQLSTCKRIFFKKKSASNYFMKMGTQYDENLTENKFFQELRKNYEDVLKTVSENNWIVCIPRAGAFTNTELTRSEVLEHILIRNLNDNYYNLNRKEITKDGTTLIYDCDNLKKTVRILFYEDFLIDKQKFMVWCVDEFLFNANCHRNEIIEINNFCDCINLLWTDNLGCLVLDEINTLVQKFLSQHSFDELNLNQLQSTVNDLYLECLNVVLKNFEENNDNFLKNVKLAVESFMQACFKEKLFSYVCTYTAASDANLNKMIRNCQDVSMKILEIDQKFSDFLPVAKLELNKINNSSIILNKIICLKRVLQHLNEANSEILLKIFIFLIIKSNVCNWMANLVFMTKFSFSKESFCDENDFLVTTLNAALKYVTGNNLGNLKVDESNENNKFNDITTHIKTGDLTLLMQNLNYKSKLTEKLCHPLCSCDSCEDLLKTNSCEINGRDERGRTFLHFAAKSPHPDIVHFLITEGSDINATDYSGSTPLHYAAAIGNQHAAFLLLHAGCDSNFKDFEGNTPLHIAVKNGHENCVEALLFFTNNNGVNVNVNSMNNNGDTPLHFASKYGYLNLVKLLLEFGAKIISNKRNITPLLVAHNEYVKEILLVNAVIENYDIIESNNENLSIASSLDKCKVKHDIPSTLEKEKSNQNCGQCPKDLNQIKKTDLLLKSIESNDMPLTCFYLGIPMTNSSPDIKNNCHPLCNCEKCSNLSDDASAVPLNKHNVVNVNVCNPDGFTPLHFAAKYGRIEILRLLLDAGSSVNLRTYKNLYTPLHLSCINKRKHVVKELLKCGSCNVDPVDSMGNTPLHYSCSNNDVEVFEMLLSEGCDASLKNNEKKSVKDIADENMFLNILKILNDRAKKTCRSDDFVL